MDYNKVAKEILELVGGEGNVQSAAHCATRLRLVLKDEKKIKVKELEKMDDVKGTFKNSGQFQVIIGQGKVNKVYDAFVQGTNITEASLSGNKEAAMSKMNIFERFARTLSNIFVPIIPAIVASGLLMGVLGLLQNFHLVNDKSGIYIMLNMFSNAAFQFLPMIIAFSAAREFNTNPFIAAALGAIMIHPDLQNAWTLGETATKTISIFGLHLGMVGYQGTVLPILISVWVMGYIERNLRKIIPNALDILLTPFLTLMISGFFAMMVIGPVGRFLGDGISFGLQALYNTAGPVAGFVFGGLYPFIVITGIHHSFQAVEAGLLANPSIHRNFLLPIWSMSNVAQGGAALAVYFITRDKKIKSIAPTASLSCLLGITEPAIFGVNLRYTKPFIAGAIGGAFGGAYEVFMNVSMTGIGVSGIPGTAIVKGNSIINYIIGMVIAFGVAFAAAFALGIKKKGEEKTDDTEIKEEETVEEKQALTDKTEETVIIGSPLNGRFVPLKEVPDRTFAEGMIGNGAAVEPSDGEVAAPVDATIVHVFETKHAVALKTKQGLEMLIHIGIDTVNMNGDGFESFVNDGDEVKKGQKLIEFDLEKVKKEAKSSITSVLITNTENTTFIKETKDDKIKRGDNLFTVGVK